MVAKKSVKKTNVRKKPSVKRSSSSKKPIIRKKPSVKRKRPTKKTKKITHHPLKITNDKFIKNFMNKTGFYKYVRLPLYILLATVVVVFLVDLLLYTTYTSSQVLIIKNSFYYILFTTIATLVSLLSFMYLGHKAADHNLIFDKLFSIVLNLVLMVVIVEIVLIFISFLTFLSPFVIYNFDNFMTQQLYLFYLISWTIVKSVIYLFMTALSYLVFYKIRFIKI